MSKGDIACRERHCARAQRGFSFVLTGSLFYDANDTPHPSKRSGEERMKEYKAAHTDSSQG
jgi:hypothetical protein